MSGPVTVTRGDGADEHTYTLTMGWSGRYYPATRLSPEDWPDPFVKEALLDGVPIPPLDVPDDVVLEAARIESEREAEREDDTREDAWERRERGDD